MDRSGTNLHNIRRMEFEKKRPYEGQRREQSFKSENTINLDIHKLQRKLDYASIKERALLPAEIRSREEAYVRGSNGWACPH